MTGRRELVVIVIWLCLGGGFCAVHPQQLTDREKATWVLDYLEQNTSVPLLVKLYNFGVSLMNSYDQIELKFLENTLMSAAETNAGQGLANIVVKRLDDAYNKSGLSGWNASYLQQNALNASQLLKDNFDVFGTAEDILRLIDTPWAADLLVKVKNVADDLVSKFGRTGAKIIAGGTLQALQADSVISVEQLLLSRLYDAYNASGLASWNETFLREHQAEAGMLIASHFDAVGTTLDLLRQGSAAVGAVSFPLNLSLPMPTRNKTPTACSADIMDVLNGILEMDQFPWARSIFDATGKIPSGVLKGKMSMLGSYDECLEVKVNIPAGVTLGNRTRQGPRYPRSFGTKYCRATLAVDPSVLGNIDTKGVRPIIALGLCIPDTCKSDDIKGMLSLGYLQPLVDLALGDDLDLYCEEPKHVKDDPSAITAIVIVSVFVFCTIVGTLLSVCHNLRTPSKHLTGLEGSKKHNLKQNIYVINSEVKANGAKSNEDAHVYSTLNEANGKIPESNGSPSKQNGDIKSKTDLPSGYVHHSEGDTYKPRDLAQTGESPKHEPPMSHSVEGTKQSGINIQIEEAPRQETQREQSGKPTETKRPGILYRLFTCFALDINAPKVLSGKSGPGAITCLHGIRFFSITWIMLGHTYNYGLITNPGVFTMENFVDAVPMIQRFTYQAVVGGGFSVDTFYMLSGMLLAYIQVKQMLKIKANPKPGNVKYYIFYYYFHRFWRLTPMYMAVLMIFGCLTQYLGDGPMWPESLESADNCKKYWWTNLLYVNNLVHVNNMCMGWSWFLANDMQFYVISIILLYFLTINTRLGSFLIFILMSAGIASAAWKEHIYNGNFFTMKSDGGAFWNNVYITPWCRVAAFCVGMLLGVIMHEKPKHKLNKIKAVVGWCLALAMGLALVYCTYSENKEGGETWSRDFRAAYESLGRPLWAACVAWVVFACHNGAGGVVNSLLSWSGLVPLSRLSYAAYLVHPVLMMIYVFSKRNLIYLRDYDLIYLFLGHTVLTFMSAFVVSLLFEAPFMALEKIIVGKRR